MSYSVTRQDLPELEAEWNSLIFSSSVRNVFVSPLWLRIWWEEFSDNRELMLLSIRKGEELIGVAPLMIDGNQISFAGDSQICDYMDFTVQKGLEKDVVTAILEYLGNESWQELAFWAIPDYSPTLSVLPEVAQASGYSICQEPEGVCPRVLLPASWEVYLDGLSGRDRRELRRKQRRLARGSLVEMEIVSVEKEIRSALDDFLRLHTMSRAEKARFMTDSMERFFRRIVCSLAQEDLAKLYFLRLNNVRVAAVLCFEGDGERFLYNSGYNPDFAPQSVGIISKAMVLEQAIVEGKGCLDFLRGDEPYKYDLGAKDLPVHRITIHRPESRIK